MSKMEDLTRYFNEKTLTFKKGLLKPMNECLYDYCKTTFDKKGDKKAVIGVVAATGSGKSVFSVAYAFNEYISKGKKVLVIVNSVGAYRATCKNLGIDIDKVPNLCITTYQWWRMRTVITPEIKEKYSDFGLIIADEAHNGLSKNAKELLPKLFALSKGVKILAITATPKRHTGDKNTFGPGPFATFDIFDGNNLATLIGCGAIQKPVACCIEATASMNGYEALRNFPNEIARNFRECIPKINITKKTKKATFIVFFNTIADMFNSGVYLKEMLAKAFEGYECGKSIRLYNGCSDRREDDIYEMHGDINHTLQYFDECTDTGVHVICNCKALAEGHHKTMNGMILFQKTKSAPLFFQEMGRCIKVDGKHKFVILDVLCTKDRLVDDIDLDNGFEDYFYKNTKKKKYVSKVERFASMYDDVFKPLEEQGVQIDLTSFDVLGLCSSMSKSSVLSEKYDYTLENWFTNLQGLKAFIEKTKSNWFRIKNPLTKWLNVQLSKIPEGRLTKKQYMALKDLLGDSKIEKILKSAGLSYYTPANTDGNGLYYVYNLMNDGFDSDVELDELRIGRTHYSINSISDVLIKLSEFALQSNERFARSVVNGNSSTLVCCKESDFNEGGLLEDAQFLKNGYVMDSSDGNKFYCNTDKIYYKNIFSSLLRASGLSPYDVAVRLA